MDGATNPREAIGSNSPPPYEVSKDRVNQLTETANKWLITVEQIANETQAARCQDFLEQLTKMKGALDKERLESTKPLREQVEVINGNYTALSRLIDAAAARIRVLKDGWLKKLDAEKAERERIAREEAARKQREAEEAVRKAREAEETARRAAEAKRHAEETARRAAEAAKNEADEAERKRLADEAAAAKAESDRQTAAARKVDVIGSAVAVEKAEAEAAEAKAAVAEVQSEKVVVKGNYSNKASGYRTKRVATLTDIDAAYAYYRDFDPSTRAEIEAVLLKLGNAGARSGRARIPGFEITEEKVVA